MATDIFDSAMLAEIPLGHSFLEKESRCKRIFEQALRFFGPFYHLHTPEDHPVIFRDPDMYAFAMTAIGMCAHDCPRVRIITFELMSNHVHFVLCGEKDDILAFFALFKRRLKKYLETRHMAINLSRFEGKTVPIESLESLRNQIGYTNRNQYVVNPAYTPFSYPYGAGNCYFLPVNQLRADRRFGELTARAKRKLLHSHQIDYPDTYAIINGYFSPASYCAIAFGENIFRDARHYFFKLSREIEGYKEIAETLCEQVFYTDDELSAVLYKICQDHYEGQQAKLLPQSDKNTLARKLHFDYNANNAQIARLLNLPPSAVDALFPLRKKDMPRNRNRS
ncbi:MAG: hypothetical protein IKX53_06885 [Bacteroidales bacterium]|nr:hypothetical protein [Bacteroidales bacterium]